MKNKLILYGGGAVVVVMIIAALSYNQWRSSPYENLDEFAQCITDKGIVMYGTDSCSYCRAEKAEFKSAFQYINYIECDKEPERCAEANIESTPTWVLADGTKLVGKQGLERLADASECELLKK
ncbi:hypothetical protein CL629_03865 [bacterium]|nr:hypothetical protein [bacterium]|tara:strand:+ start:19019 stop:19390 length:372 start_codon:yes stop_codon:yes gene_type:complete